MTLSRSEPLNIIVNLKHFVLGQQMYFSALPIIKNKTVSEITFKTGPDTILSQFFFITIKNRKGDTLLQRYPISDLLTGKQTGMGTGSNVYTRKFNLFDVDSEKSFIEFFVTPAYSVAFVENQDIGTLHFTIN
jgi:hypothetical protein